MERRDFFVSTALGMLGLGVGNLSFAVSQPSTASQANNRKILIAGGGFGTKFLRYMASLTGKERPKLCYLPTASADRESGIIRWYENCAPLNVVPSVQVSFINSNRMKQTFEEVLLSVDGIVVSSGRPTELTRSSEKLGTAGSCSAAPAPAHFAGSKRARRIPDQRN